MNGALMDADAARFIAETVAYVRKWAGEAGYDLDAYGEAARLADDAGVDRSVISRLLKGVRTPGTAALFLIAEAIHRPPIELLVKTGTVPARFLDQDPRARVASEPVTADDLADQWGATTAEEREFVRGTVDAARKLLQGRQKRDGAQDTGS